MYGLLDKNAYLNIITHDEEQINQIRSLMKVLILNTDMAFHFNIVNKLVALVEPQSAVSEIHSTRGNFEDRGPHCLEGTPSLEGSISSCSDILPSEIDLINTDNLENRHVLISSVLHAAGNLLLR